MKLNLAALDSLERSFFIYGSYQKSEFGGATILKFGDGNVAFPAWLKADVSLLKEQTETAFRYNGPRTYLIGEVYPLVNLRDANTQDAAADEVVRQFPHRTLVTGETFYRLRKGIERGKQDSPAEYDAPPSIKRLESGRLDTQDFPVLYGSQDLEICVHECRVTIADECYAATLKVLRPLALLDLSANIIDGKTPFESLSLAMHFIFAAEKHSYYIAQAIANAARRKGFDGIIFPSYFSSLRGNVIQNIGLFGYPIAVRSLEVLCINRLLLERAKYETRLGPCLPGVTSWWAD